jgi:23S rRNA maturation-related 3'-5' exoribonuclease YhaM
MAQANGHQLIRHQEKGMSFEGVYYVESAYVKQTVQKKDYTDFMLRDKSGSRNVKYWGKVDGVTKGCFVFISAIVDDYQGNPSIVAKNVEKADEPTDMSDYLPVYDDNGPSKNADRFDNIRATLAEIEIRSGNTTAGLIVDEIYKNSAFFGKFIAAPGSARPHYGCQGGLLANTVRVAEASLSGAEAYGLNDQERAILIASALLARIGAIDAFEFQNCMPAITKRGILLGINNLTMTRIASALKRIVAALKKENLAPIDQEVAVRIMHAVTSHEGACVQPMTKEAMVLHASYQTDAQVVDALDFIETDANKTEEFTAYDPAMGRKYYTGPRT